MEACSLAEPSQLINAGFSPVNLMRCWVIKEMKVSYCSRVAQAYNTLEK
jgi:hypothetical protein